MSFGLDYNFRYSSYVSYDYDRVYDCQTSYTCYDDNTDEGNNYNSCNDICRCGRIVNAHVTSVDTWGLAKELSSEPNDSILTYCIDRTLVALKIYDQDNWDFDIGGGYYGEELGGVVLTCHGMVDTALIHLCSLKSDSDRIKFALVEEYGFLLDSIKDLEFTIETVNRVDIKIPNEAYKIQAGTGIYKDSDYEGPRGVLRESQDGHLILIDGYHRFSAFEHEEEMKMVVGFLIL